MAHAQQQNDRPYDLEERTFQFAQRVLAFINKLPKTLANHEIIRQLVRASGSVGTNYIESKRESWQERLPNAYQDIAEGIKRKPVLDSALRVHRIGERGTKVPHSRINRAYQDFQRNSQKVPVIDHLYWSLEHLYCNVNDR